MLSWAMWAMWAWGGGGAGLTCTDATAPREGTEAAWCVADNGLPHGPFEARRGDTPRVTGAFEHGVPTGRWSVYGREGELLARSPVSAGVLVGCDGDDAACWVEHVEDELAGVQRWARRLDEPVLLRSGRGRAAGFENGQMVVDLWSLWKLRMPEGREGLGLQEGRTEIYRSDGRIQVRAEHDAAGRLTGTFTVFDRHGRPVRRAGYLAGLLHGVEETWYADGTKQGSVHWVQGALHGAVQWWDRDGQQTVEGVFDEGRPCGWFTLRGMQAAKHEMCTL